MNSDPLDVEVALHLGLPLYDYTQSESPMDLPVNTHRKNDARKNRLGHEVMSAIHNGTFAGRLALQAFLHFGSRIPDSLSYEEQAYPFRYSNKPEDFLYINSAAGTGLVFTPQLTAQGADGKKYRTSKPVTYMYGTPEVPIIQSVLGNSDKLLSHKAYRTQRKSDSRGRTYWCTLRENIDAVQQADAHGLVAIVSKLLDHPDYTLPSYDMFRDQQREEYHIHHSRVARVAIKMTVADLPPEMLVVDAPQSEGSKALNLLHLYPDPQTMGERLGVPIEPLGGSWDFNLPANR